jgi:hypothetical protein
MPDATESPLPPGIFPAGTQAKDSSVSLIGVDPILISFLTRLGLIHMHLFDSIMTVTSARDAVHGKGSKHYIGKALDLRISDLPPRSLITFMAVLWELTPRYKLAVFDEEQCIGAQHIHVELAG